MLWIIFLKSTIAHTKMGHVSKTTPLLGVICHPFSKTWYNLPLQQIWQLELQPFLRYGWEPRDVTKSLSGMFCRPSAGTSHDQPVHQIWSLYVYSLRSYERRQKMQKLGWFRGLGVTQGHRKYSHLIEHIRLNSYSTLIESRAYTSILYRFRVIARFSSKVANFNPPHP